MGWLESLGLTFHSFALIVVLLMLVSALFSVLLQTTKRNLTLRQTLHDRNEETQRLRRLVQAQQGQQQRPATAPTRRLVAVKKSTAPSKPKSKPRAKKPTEPPRSVWERIKKPDL